MDQRLIIGSPSYLREVENENDMSIKHLQIWSPAGSVSYLLAVMSMKYAQRCRECHDLYHAVLGLPPSSVEGEIAPKAFEFVNIGLLMGLLSLFAIIRFKAQERERFFNIYLPWALEAAHRSKPIINVYWDEELETDVDVLLSHLEIERPPDLPDLRRKQTGR